MAFVALGVLLVALAILLGSGLAAVAVAIFAAVFAARRTTYGSFDNASAAIVSSAAATVNDTSPVVYT